MSDSSLHLLIFPSFCPSLPPSFYFFLLFFYFLNTPKGCVLWLCAFLYGSKLAYAQEYERQKSHTICLPQFVLHPIFQTELQNESAVSKFSYPCLSSDLLGYVCLYQSIFWDSHVYLYMVFLCWHGGSENKFSYSHRKNFNFNPVSPDPILLVFYVRRYS